MPSLPSLPSCADPSPKTPKNIGRSVFVQGLGMVSNFMASEDLNVCVDALMQKKSKA